MTPAEVERHQRKRLYAATVAVVAEHGYGGTSVESLCRIAGVSRAAFYNLFDSREDCFLATIDELREDGVARIGKAQRRENGWERRIRAAIEEIFAIPVEQPAAAHVYVVDVFEAGPAGRLRAKEGLKVFEDFLARNLAESPTRAGLSAQIVAALVGGVRMLTHDRLRSDAVEDLPAMAAEIGDWILSYETPPRPLPDGPSRAVDALRESEDEDVGERILRAVAEICLSEGVTRLTVDAIAARARISLTTLYKHFPRGAQEAFVGAFETIVGRCLAEARVGYATEDDWPAQMHAVNERLFAYLAANPAFASVALVEVMGAGPEALKRRDVLLKSFGELLEGGTQLAPAVSKVTREAIVVAVYSLVRRTIEVEGAEAVPRLVPIATYIELAPFVGAERALDVANGAPRMGEASDTSLAPSAAPAR